MSNYLRKNNAAPRSRRKLWLAAGAAGLTGVVSLAGVAAASNVGGAGFDRLASLKWSTAEQIVKSGAGDDRRDRDDRGGQHPDGRGWHGKDGRDRDRDRDREKDGKELPCDAETLVEEVNRANLDNGGVFKLAKDCTYRLTESTDTGPNAFPAIVQRITLVGNNSTLFHDGTALFRFFQVNSGGQLTLKDLTLRGGQISAPPPPPSGANGGALLVQDGGKAILTHTKLVDNRVTGVGNQGNGGAIANFGEVEIRNSLLANNHARGVGNGGNGGAIYNEGILTIRDTHLDNNTATGNSVVSGNGGAIANVANGITTIAHSQITNNKASNDGGGIHNNNTARLTVTHTKIANNTACRNGGGINNNGNATMTLEHVTITENKATGNGGGVYNTSTTVATIRNAAFIDNTAGNNGGGLFNDNNSNLNLFDSRFHGNHAAQGGAIYNDNNATLTIRTSDIIRNFASTTAGAGGIFNNTTGTVSLDNKTNIKKNEPRNCTNVTGCAN